MCTYGANFLILNIKLQSEQWWYALISLAGWIYNWICTYDAHLISYYHANRICTCGAIFYLLPSIFNRNYDNKGRNSYRLWLVGFKTEFPLMVPIQIFSKLSVSQNNDNKVTSCQLWHAKFKTEFVLIVPIFRIMICGWMNLQLNFRLWCQFK